MAEKAHVSRGHTVLAFLFKVGQEDSARFQIRQIEPRNRLMSLSGKNQQQQNNAVAVAVDADYSAEKIGVRSSSTPPGR
jgi:hypothetical protein